MLWLAGSAARRPSRPFSGGDCPSCRSIICKVPDRTRTLGLREKVDPEGPFCTRPTTLIHESFCPPNP